MRTHLAKNFASDLRDQLAAYEITDTTVRYCGQCPGCLVLTVEEREIPRLLVQIGQ